jgi:hypothetical protein
VASALGTEATEWDAFWGTASRASLVFWSKVAEALSTTPAKGVTFAGLKKD